MTSGNQRYVAVCANLYYSGNSDLCSLIYTNIQWAGAARAVRTKAVEKVFPFLFPSIERRIEREPNKKVTSAYGNVSTHFDTTTCLH